MSASEAKGVVIIGAGQGGFQTAWSLRTKGYEGRITLVGEEPHLPYQRPPLSKGMLTGKQEARHAILRPAAFYEKQRIDLIAADRATEIDRAAQRVKLSSGASLDYAHLVLATGARNRELPLPGAQFNGAHLDGVHYLRDLTEAEQLREHLQQAERVAIIGGGFIGLEVAAASRTQGKSVTVIEAGERLMGRVVAPAMSDFFLHQHSEHGAKVLTSAAAESIGAENHRARQVILSDGTRVPADLLVIGIGVIPNVELAEAAGLAVANGIIADTDLRTQDPRIFAIGDCASYPNEYSGTRVRLESVQNAVDQAVSVAEQIVGTGTPYDAAPWFWTEQYDIRLQMAGLSIGYDQVVERGVPDSGDFSLFYYREGSLISVNSINRPAEHLTARRLIAARAQVRPEQAADESIDLKELVRPS